VRQLIKATDGNLGKKKLKTGYLIFDVFKLE
jgi:hypothetical protein